MVNLLRGGTPPSPPTPKSSLEGVPRSLVGMGDIAIQPVFSLLVPLDVKKSGSIDQNSPTAIPKIL